ncbi:MAG: glycerol-3-phosphate dehydrogenase C-terminal domain-containing protein, partial [Bdellovibrionales bacterium]
AFTIRMPGSRNFFVQPHVTSGGITGGTTERPVANLNEPDDPVLRDDQVNEIISKFNAAFTAQASTRDVIYTWSGERPIIKPANDDGSTVSRDYEITTDAPGFITVWGGKLTANPAMGRDAVDTIVANMPKERVSQLLKSPWVRKEKLSGGHIPDDDFEAFLAKKQRQFEWVESPDMIKRMARAYGSSIDEVIGISSRSKRDLGHNFNDSANPLYQKEVEYLVREEFARSVNDILYRRTKLGIMMSGSRLDVSGKADTSSDDRVKTLERFVGKEVALLDQDIGHP